LYDLDLTGAERNDADLFTTISSRTRKPQNFAPRWRLVTYDQFHGIPKGGIDQSAQRVSQSMRYLFCRKRENGRQRDNGEEIERENPSGAPFLLASEDAEGYEDEKDVDPS